MADQPKQNEIKIELTPEVARGYYANLAMILHSPSEFIFDFINVTPGMPKANVQTRVIMAPEHAKNLLFALRDALTKYETTFGEIERKTPINNGQNNNNFQA